MVHVSVQVVSSYVTPWLSNTCLISVISFVITLYNALQPRKMYIVIFNPQIIPTIKLLPLLGENIRDYCIISMNFKL
jgi:hypothetical protein